MTRIILSYFLFFILLTGCTLNNKTGSEKPVVTVSILPQEYFVKQIAGDRVDVSVMIPPGANPATYEPTPRQLQDLTKTSVYLEIGNSAFESAWMDKFRSINPTMKITDLSRNVPLIYEEHQHNGEHQSVNPHIWLSPRNGKIIAQNVAADLNLILPADSAFFRKNLEQLLLKIDTLEQTMHSELDTLTHRAFLIYHPALTYLAKDFGLEQYALETEGKEPSPAHMKYLTDLAREKGISVIFLQMQFDQHNAEILSHETGAEIVQINPLDPDWYRQMLFIASTLKEKLQ